METTSSPSSYTEKDKKSEKISGDEVANPSEDSNNMPVPVPDEKEAERTKQLNDEEEAAERTRGLPDVELEGKHTSDDHETVEEEIEAESTKGLTDEPVKEQETERTRGTITTDDKPVKEDQEAAERKIGLTDEPVKQREAERTRVIVGADHGEDKKKKKSKKPKKKMFSIIRLGIRFISTDDNEPVKGDQEEAERKTVHTDEPVGEEAEAEAESTKGLIDEPVEEQETERTRVVIGDDEEDHKKIKKDHQEVEEK